MIWVIVSANTVEFRNAKSFIIHPTTTGDWHFSIRKVFISLAQKSEVYQDHYILVEKASLKFAHRPLGSQGWRSVPSITIELHLIHSTCHAQGKNKSNHLVELIHNLDVNCIRYVQCKYVKCACRKTTTIFRGRLTSNAVAGCTSLGACGHARAEKRGLG